MGVTFTYVTSVHFFIFVAVLLWSIKIPEERLCRLHEIVSFEVELKEEEDFDRKGILDPAGWSGSQRLNGLKKKSI